MGEPLERGPVRTLATLIAAIALATVPGAFAQDGAGTGKFTAANTGAAFKVGGALTNITGIVAVGTKGRDNNVWKQIN